LYVNCNATYSGLVLYLELMDEDSPKFDIDGAVYQRLVIWVDKDNRIAAAAFDKKLPEGDGLIRVTWNFKKCTDIPHATASLWSIGDYGYSVWRVGADKKVTPFLGTVEE
jgi:hypothetical protein